MHHEIRRNSTALSARAEREGEERGRGWSSLLLLLRGFFISVDPDEEYHPVESTFGTPGNEKRETRDATSTRGRRKPNRRRIRQTSSVFPCAASGWPFPVVVLRAADLFVAGGIGGAELLVARRRNCPTLNEIVEPLCPSNLVVGTSGIGIVESTPVHRSPS